MSFAVVEGDEIVIRIPFSALPIALECYCETHIDPADEYYRIVDLDEVVSEFVSAFNEEDNDEKFSNMLDSVLERVLENGAFGMEEYLKYPDEDAEDY